VPTIITGFSLPDANIHSPNENMLVQYIPQGIAAARALFEEFAAL
jgi:acetylornithine deacetylase/succinyl-diaminopimelate desuccinylase-like protein